MSTLFQLKEGMAMLGQQIKEDASWITENAAKPDVDIKSLEEKEAHKNDLQKRFNLLKEEHDALEREESQKVQKTAEIETDPKKKALLSKGEFYKAALTNGNVDNVLKAYSMLGGIPALDADLGYGSRLLPTNMTNELILEPLVENPMRSIVRLSNITGLEEPKLLFDLDDAYDNVTDKETAKEVELEGDRVSYGRNKVKVRAKVSDTIIHGSPLNLATEIENALRSGLAANEMARMFAAAPTSPYAAMSFYSTANAVKVVSGDSKQQAIGKALADLPIAFRRNAKIVMNAVDWYEMWEANLNKSGMFFENRPLSLYGKEVVLVDDAAKPIVGDFNYSRINYDISTIYDTDKDVDGGIYKFVLTAWYDIKLRLKSAFRIADVAEVTTP